MKRILPTLIFLFPLQYFSIKVSTTGFDLFPIALILTLTFETLYFKKFKNITNSELTALCFLFLLNILVWLVFRHAPVSRFLSALLWLSSLVYLAFASNKFYSKKFYDNLILASFLSTLLLIFQFLYLHIERPKAFYIEPSTAGLIYYSLVIMFLYRFIYLGFKKINKNEVFLTIIFLFCGLITKSSHLVLLFIIPVLLSIYHINFKSIIFLLLLILPVFALIIYFLINNPYVVSKFDFSNSEDFNLSQLAWLRGLDQAIYVIKHSPIFGYGLGSTGMFYFPSNYTYLLDRTEFPDLNLLDAYSLFFRFTIEIGLGMLVCILYIIHKRVKIVVREFHKKSNPSILNQHSLFIFGLCIFIGSLIKEPNYGLSPLFLSVICMSFNLKHQSV